MNIPDQYKVNHLFVLVGENPLPNYVAARTLLHDGDTVYLVFTKNTIFQKDRLQGEDGLHKLGIKCQPVDLSNNESNAQEIYDIIKKRVNESAKEGKVGLNYTGGTKAMAVHAYRAIQELKHDAIFSYLDPRRLKMWINQYQQKPTAYDVTLQVSLEELFTLHGKYLLTNFPPITEPYLQELAAEIAKVHENQDSEKKWKEWCNKLTPIAELQGLFPDVANLLGEYLDLPQNKSLKNQARANFSNFKEFHTWLNGTWLESYLLKKVQDISNDIGAQKEDIQMSFNIVEDKGKVNTNNKAADAKFEFDVAFIKGYQLFAISCTAKSKKADCKEKLFEASLRAKELGGDEARVALVCCYDDPQEIEDELARFGTRDPKVKVFGRSHLAKLDEAIAEWVDVVEQESKA